MLCGCRQTTSILTGKNQYVLVVWPTTFNWYHDDMRGVYSLKMIGYGGSVNKGFFPVIHWALVNFPEIRGFC